MNRKNMLQVVLDSNVYISALLFSCIPNRILKLAIERKIKILISKEIISETAKILRQKFIWPEHNVNRFVRRISHLGEIIKTAETTNAVKEKPSDNRILECAVAGNADVIISGDKHLLGLKTYRGISVRNPKYFTYSIRK